MILSPSAFDIFSSYTDSLSLTSFRKGTIRSTCLRKKARHYRETCRELANAMSLYPQDSDIKIGLPIRNGVVIVPSSWLTCYELVLDAQIKEQLAIANRRDGGTLPDCMDACALFNKYLASFAKLGAFA